MCNVANTLVDHPQHTSLSIIDFYKTNTFSLCKIVQVCVCVCVCVCVFDSFAVVFSGGKNEFWSVKLWETQPGIGPCTIALYKYVCSVIFSK